MASNNWPKVGLYARQHSLFCQVATQPHRSVLLLGASSLCSQPLQHPSSIDVHTTNYMTLLMNITEVHTNKQCCSPRDHGLGLEAPRGHKVKPWSWSWSCYKGLGHFRDFSMFFDFFPPFLLVLV